VISIKHRQLALKKKTLSKTEGEYFDGCREELTGITIPLKYLPCGNRQDFVALLLLNMPVMPIAQLLN